MDRQPLQSLLAEAARRAEGSSKAQPAAGQVFPPKTYKPMSASELTVASVLGGAAERPDSATKRAEEEAKKAEEAAKAAAAKGGKPDPKAPAGGVQQQAEIPKDEEDDQQIQATESELDRIKHVYVNLLL